MLQRSFLLLLLAVLLLIAGCSAEDSRHLSSTLKDAYLERMATLAEHVRRSDDGSASLALLVAQNADRQGVTSRLSIEPSRFSGLYQVHADKRLLGYIDNTASYMIACDGECANATGGNVVVSAAASGGHGTMAGGDGRMRRRLPMQMHVQRVRASPIDGLEEVELEGAQLVYADKKRQYVFWGHLLDLKKGIDLTDAHYRQLAHADLGPLPLDEAEKQVRGNGKRQLVVFSDTACQPCQSVEQQTLAGLDNVTIYRFALGSSSATTGRTKQLARKLDIDVWPTFVFANGRMVSLPSMAQGLQGFMPALMENWLNDV